MLDTLLLTVVYICWLLNKGLNKMGEPKKIPLRDNPRTKEIQQIRLEGNNNWINKFYEDNSQNNSESIQQLESDQTN